MGVLILGAISSVLLARFDELLGLATVFTVAHFFLFCNVLRMSRLLELLWAALFVLLATSTIIMGVPVWNYTFTIMLAVTAIFAVIQVFRPSYHGAFWMQINPDLPQWWASNQAEKQ